MVSIKNALLWWVGDIDKLNLAKERVKIKIKIKNSLLELLNGNSCFKEALQMLPTSP